MIEESRSNRTTSKKPDFGAAYLPVGSAPSLKTRHGKSQAALPRESSLPPFKPCLDEMGVIFTPREPSLHARRASSPSVHPCAKHSALEHAVQGLPSEAHGYPADLPGPWRAF